ncbi:MAG: hypothetical protein KC457_14415 [Myxococcales bacterium]|nr:hypothetical protein [Myxococcales bacterium]
MKTDPSAISRWRTARRLTLGAIVVAGTMSTAAAVAHRVADHPCHSHAQTRTQVNSYYTYSGIGVELMQDGDDFIVSRVFPGTPADGKIFAGATLLQVDGQRPTDMRDFTRMIRGEAGTAVALEVAYPCEGHETVVIERAVVHIPETGLR